MSYQAIVLAAGAGSRYGNGKLLSDYRGRPLVFAAVEAALAAQVDEVIVVLGHDGARVAAGLGPLATARLRPVIAFDWQEGLSASLRCGIGCLPKSSLGALLFLGDMPGITPDLPARVLEALHSGAIAAQPMHRGRPAHPVGFSADLYGQISRLDGDAGAGALLRTLPGVVRFEAGNAGAVFDVDTPQDALAQDQT